MNFNSALAIGEEEAYSSKPVSDTSSQQNQQMTFNGKFYLLEKSTEGSQNI